MILVIALGNPGLEYEKTRHNAGWLVLDSFLDDWGQNKYAQTLETRVGEVLYAKPQTFMNKSGESLSWYLKEYELSGENIIVVYDDVDLPVGSVKVSFDRGDAGHNGIKSLVQHFGSRAFVRVRVGVAPVGEDGNVQKIQSRKSFVLKNFSKDDLGKVEGLSAKVEKVIKVISEKGYLLAMNEMN